MNSSSRTIAFLSYLLSIVGWLYALAFQRRDPFVFYHARQSMLLTIVALAAPLAWFVLAWVLAWIPLIGPVLSILLFSLVIATELLLFVGWIGGMRNALRGQIHPAPLVGAWAERLPLGTLPVEVIAPEPSKPPVL